MPNLLLDLEVDRVDLVDEGSNSVAFIELYKRKECNKSMDYEQILGSLNAEHAEVIRKAVADAKAEIPEATVAELAKAKQDLEAANSTVATEIAKSKCLSDQLNQMAAAKKEETEEEVLKALPESARAIFDRYKSKIDAAEAVAKSAQAQQLENEAIAKAKELKAIPVEEAKLVAVVKSATPELIEVLKAASTMIEKGSLLDESGVSKGKSGASTQDEAWDKIEKKAKEISNAEKITVQKAIGEVIKREPALYAEYLKGGTE